MSQRTAPDVRIETAFSHRGNHKVVGLPTTIPGTPIGY